MLLGQSGMLSFGHAVYVGLGAFLAIHAMNAVSRGAFWLPTSLIPLVGGLAGAFFAVLFGYVTTKKSGTTFAMITLGIGELVASSSLMLPEFFGGEAGITTNRVIGKPVLGITFGPQIQVYYLIAIWCLICTIAMYAFTRTPLGRMANAVRDNPERAEFVGYDTQRVRYLVVIIAGFFAGIAGGLGAINFEIVSSENVSTVRSGAYLLFTFLGGVGFFVGPIIGAVLFVLSFVVLSELTKAWLLYLGIFFLLMVMYAPGGIASLVMMNLRVARFGKFRRLVRAVRRGDRGGAAAVPRHRGDDRDDLPLPARVGERDDEDAVRHRGRHRDADAVDRRGRARRRRRASRCASPARWFRRVWGGAQGEIQARARAGDRMTRAARSNCATCASRFGKSEIIRGATLSIPAGERHAVIGPNGAGKSTLFNLISGRFGVTSGAILLNGRDTAGLTPFQINRLGLSRSFQITNIFHRLSVFENIRCAVLWSLGYRYSFWQSLDRLRDARVRADEVLELIGLKRRRDVAAGMLTYAEQRALEIGITVAGGATVILLDEPTAGMSRSESDHAVELIRRVTVGQAR